MYKFCVVMVVKDEACYVEQAVRSVLVRSDCVLFVVDDSSQDNTFQILEGLALAFAPRLFVGRNESVGKVAAYRSIKELPNSEFVLFLDGDDFFSNKWAHWHPNLDTSCIYYYDLCILNEANSLSTLANPKISSIDKTRLLHELILLPKASWLVPAELVTGFLQIPDGVEFEDFWFSVKAYMLTNEIRHLEEKWYMYRQHQNQTYGQLNRGGRELFEFRNKRILKSIKAVRSSNRDLHDLLELQQKRYELLLFGDLWTIFRELGAREAFLRYMKLYAPNLLGNIKNFIRMRIK